VKRLISILSLLVALSSIGRPAVAEEERSEPRFTLRPEAKLQLEWDSNAIRDVGGTSDTIFKTFAGFTAAYKFPTDTAITGQYQLQLWRFLSQSVNSTLLNVGTLLVSQKIATPWFTSLDPFLGAQIIAKSPTDLVGGVARTDYNLLAGFNIVQSIDTDSLFVGGYRYDRLQAEVFETQFSGHALNFAYRNAFDKQFLFAAGYELQYRVALATTAEDVLRNSVSVGMDYYPIQWLRVGATAQYVNDIFTSSRTARTVGGVDYWVIGLNVGSNLLFGW